jgi:hypothetical protein
MTDEHRVRTVGVQLTPGLVRDPERYLASLLEGEVTERRELPIAGVITLPPRTSGGRADP